MSQAASLPPSLPGRAPAPTAGSAAPDAATPRGLVPLLAAARARAAAGETGAAYALLNEALQRQPDHAPWLLCVAGALRDGRAEDAATYTDLLQTPGAIARLHVPSMTPDDAEASPGSRLPFVGEALGLRRAARRGALRAAEGDARAAVAPLVAVYLATPAGRLASVAPRVAIQVALLLDEAGLSAEAWDIVAFAAGRWPRSLALRTVAARFAVEERRWDALGGLLAPVFAASATPRLARGYEALHALAQGRLAHCADHFDQYGIPHDAAFLAELALLLAPHDARFGRRDDELPGSIALPADKDALRSLGGAERLLLRERFEEGLAALDRAGAAPLPAPGAIPSGAQALWLRLRGFALFRLGRFDEAALAFAAASAGDPHEPWYVSGAGQSFLLRGDPASAVACFRQVQPAGPDDFAALFHLGLAYGRLGRLGDARRALRRAFREFFVDTLEVSLQPMIRAILGPAAKAAHATTMHL